MNVKVNINVFVDIFIYRRAELVYKLIIYKKKWFLLWTQRFSLINEDYR